MVYKVLFIGTLLLLLLAPVGFRLVFALDIGGQKATVKAAKYRPRRRYLALEVNYGT